MPDLITATFFSILAAGFFVGVVVGLTGMGGGALMTPALIFLGVGDAATVVTADLTAAAVYKTGGAIVHKREGSPNMRLAKWLVVGSVPMALLGPYLVSWFTDPEDLDSTLKLCIGFALLFAAATYALRLYINLVRRVRGRGAQAPADPQRAPDPHAARRRTGRAAGGHHQRGLGLGDHDRAADALPRAGRGAPGRHRPGAGRAAGARRGGLQHRPARPGLGDPGPAGHRLGARHPDRQQDRAAGAAVGHPPRHRDRADHVAASRCSTRPAGRRSAPARTRPTPSCGAGGLVMLVVLPLVWGLLRRRQGHDEFRTRDRRATSTPTTCTGAEVLRHGTEPAATSRVGNTRTCS